METISDEQLLEVYSKAIELNLAKDFVEMLRTEITRRGLNADQK